MFTMETGRSRGLWIPERREASRARAGRRYRLTADDRPRAEAICAATDNPARLISYDIRSVTSGTEALGEATVQMQQGDIKVIGRGASTDVIEASARAYIDGLNKLSALARRKESEQQQMFVDHAP